MTSFRPLAQAALASVCTLLFAAPLVGQVQRTSPALELSYMERDGQELRYLYQVNGYASGGQRMADVYLEIWSPKEGAATVVDDHRGAFLFDAIREQRQQISYGHPPLFVATPEDWVAAIYIQGVLNWGAQRKAGGENHGVVTGEELRGFELVSSALPALRKFRAVPYRSPRNADRGFSRPTVEQTVQDSTWVLYNGVVLAPGWQRQQVTPDYLRVQLDRACDAVLIENCGRYLRHLDRIQTADEAGDDAAFSEAVRTMRQEVAGDEVSHDHARLVLRETLSALQERAPSARTH